MVLTLYQRFSDDLQSYPSAPLPLTSAGRSAGVRGERTGQKAVPSPTSPLLNNTPNCLGRSSSGTVLGCGPTLILSRPLHVPQHFVTWRHYWVMDGVFTGYFHVYFKDINSSLGRLALIFHILVGGCNIKIWGSGSGRIS